MQIRQLALHFVPEADRLLLRVNTSDQQQFAVWLTRRLCLRLWPHLDSMVTTLGVTQVAAQAAPGATLMPEAASMLADAARERALRGSDFSQPFDEHPTTQPLGPEPLLATAVQLSPAKPGLLHLAISDASRRQIQLALTEQLATAVRELMHKALVKAEWGVIPAAAVQPPGDAPPRVLN